MTEPPLVVETRDQAAVLGEVLSCRDSGRPCAVLDPTWPAGLRARARAAVRRAGEQARLRAGDLVVFSSGSTGAPRGIVRTSQSWRASEQPLSAVTGIGGGDAVWLPGPLWSSLSLYGAWHAAAVGAEPVLAGHAPAAPPGHATAVHCVPAALPGLLDDVRAGRLPRLRVAVVAGDRVPAAARTAAERHGVRLVEYYGAAELSFVAWRDDPGPLRPFPGAQLRVTDGRVWVRSPYTAREYLDPATGGPLLRDAGGWASVGDLGSVRGDGLEVHGRGDAAVTTGGHTVAVEDVEVVLRGVAGVRDVAVTGLPHPRLGALLAAVVVGPATDTDLRTAARALPAPSRPRVWLRAGALPRTSGGKLRRPEVARLAARLAAR